MLLLMLAAQGTVASPVMVAPPDPIGSTNPGIAHATTSADLLRRGGHRRYARFVLPLLTLLLLYNEWQQLQS